MPSFILCTLYTLVIFWDKIKYRTVQYSIDVKSVYNYDCRYSTI